MIADQPSNARPLTILMVEDNDLMAQTARMLLEELGYKVEHAPAARQALETLERIPVDLVFTDVMMPGEMNGLALARTIRERDPRKPIVVTTGYYSAIEGVHDFLVLKKPYAIDRLAEVLQQALEACPP